MSKIFRSSLMGGFRKKDVISYLDELGAEKREAERTCEKLRAELAQSRQAPPADERAEHMEEQVNQLREQAAKQKNEIILLQDKCARYEVAQVELKSGIESRDAKIAGLEAREDYSEECEQLRRRVKELESIKAASAEPRQISELTLAIKCNPDSAAAESRQAEEALKEFSRSVDEITREFSRLLDTMSESGADVIAKSSEKLTSIKDILARVRAVSEK